MAAWIGAHATAQSPPGESDPPPAHSLVLEDDARDVQLPSARDPFDRFKRVKLNDDGTAWADFGAELRVRMERWSDFAFNRQNEDTFVLGRALVHADLNFGTRLRVFLEGESAAPLNDRDLPGGTRGLDADVLDLQNAFVEYAAVQGEHASLVLRMGRQELQFGKQRLVSPLPWSNSQRSWDGVRGTLEVADWTIDGFYTRYTPVDRYAFNDWQGGADFYGAYATTSLPARAGALGIDLYFLGLNDDTASFNTTTGDEDRFTLGTRLAGKIADSRFDIDTEGTFQFGSVGSSDIRAFSIAAELGYRIPWHAVKPRLHLGFDYASGDGSPDDDDVGTFNQLFPLGHAYFGYADLVGRQNIIDLSGGVSISPHERVTIRLAGHMFWRASDQDALYNAGGGVVREGALSRAREVGQEIDLVGTYKLGPHTTLEAGYSHFFAGRFIDQSGPSADVDWVYVQATYRF